MRFVLPAVCLAAFNQLNKLFSASQPYAELFSARAQPLGFPLSLNPCLPVSLGGFFRISREGGLGKPFRYFFERCLQSIANTPVLVQRFRLQSDLFLPRSLFLVVLLHPRFPALPRRSVSASER